MARALTLAALLSFVICLHASPIEAEAASRDSDVHLTRAAEEMWDEGKGKADDHDHWERIVRRSVDWYDPYYRDDTLHIVNVQEYYRNVLEEQEWTDDRQMEHELASLMHYWNFGKQADVEVDSINMKDLQKPIPGRYIVMLDSSADSYTLDKTIAILQHAHTESEGRIRADHITPMRNLGLGFTATMNSKTVELVR